MMKWIVTFVVCSVVKESVGAPQGGLNLRDDGEIYDDVIAATTSDDAKRVRREDGRTVMDILTGNVPMGSDDVVDGSDVVRVTRSADDPMLISPGPAPCGQARDSGPFSGPYQQQYFDPKNGPQADPRTHISVPIHGGLIGHQEGLLKPVQKETIFYATIPFISGYKLSPITSLKKVVVTDLPVHGHGELIGGHIGLGGLGGLGGGHIGLDGLGGLGGGGLLHDGLLPGLSPLPLGSLPAGLPLGGLGGGGLLHDGLLPGLPGLPALPLGGLSHGGLPRSSRPDYMTQPDFMTQEDYPCPAGLDNVFTQSRSSHPQDFYIANPEVRHPLDLNIFFETPEAAASRDAAPELLTPETYVDAIRNLQQQMDHIHSLKLAQERQNQPEEINFV